MNYPFLFFMFLYTYYCFQHGKNKNHLQEAGLHFSLAFSPLSFTDNEAVFSQARCQYVVSHYTAHSFKLSLLKDREELP